MSPHVSDFAKRVAYEFHRYRVGDLTAFNAAQNALKELQTDYANTQKQLDAAQKAADSELEVLAKNEEGRLKKQELAVKTYTDALQQQVDTLRQQGRRATAGLGQGDRQRGLTDQQNAIDDRFNDRFNSQKLDLANQYGDGSRGMSQWFLLDEATSDAKRSWEDDLLVVH